MKISPFCLSRISPFNPTDTIKIDFDRLEEVSLGEVELKRELLVALLNVINLNLETIKQARTTNDYSTIAKCAHQLKGAGANVGVSSLYAIAIELESQAKTQNLSDVADLVIALDSQRLGVKSYLSQEFP